MGLEEEIINEYQKLVGVHFRMNESLEKAVKILSGIISGEYNTGVIMSGRTGVGKTQLLKASITVWNRHNKIDVEYLPSSKLKTIMINSEGYSSTIDYRMPFLAIDDFGAEPERIINYGMEITPFVDIIQYRSDMVDKRKILLATTNLSPSMISDRYGDRVLSRLRGENKIILIDGDDHRIK